MSYLTQANRCNRNGTHRNGEMSHLTSLQFTTIPYTAAYNHFAHSRSTLMLGQSRHI